MLYPLCRPIHRCAEALAQPWRIVVAAAVSLCLFIGSALAQAQQIRVPSGQSVSLIEVLLDEEPGALWVRFRFLAPEIAAAPSDEALFADMDDLCNRLAHPYLAHHKIMPERVVVSLSDRAVPFGTRMPDARQLFEVYRITPTGCEWEGG